MITQPELFRPDPSDPNIEDLKRLLHDRRDWVTSTTITILTGWSDRQIRSLAATSDGWIISGQRGYKYILHASEDEVHHAAAWLESQAKIMSTRAGSIRRRAHSLVG